MNKALLGFFCLTSVLFSCTKQEIVPFTGHIKPKIKFLYEGFKYSTGTKDGETEPYYTTSDFEIYEEDIDGDFNVRETIYHGPDTNYDYHYFYLDPDFYGYDGNFFVFLEGVPGQMIVNDTYYCIDVNVPITTPKGKFTCNKFLRVNEDHDSTYIYSDVNLQYPFIRMEYKPDDYDYFTITELIK